MFAYESRENWVKSINHCEGTARRRNQKVSTFCWLSWRTMKALLVFFFLFFSFTSKRQQLTPWPFTTLIFKTTNPISFDDDRNFQVHWNSSYSSTSEFNWNFYDYSSFRWLNSFTLSFITRNRKNSWGKNTENNIGSRNKNKLLDSQTRRLSKRINNCSHKPNNPAAQWKYQVFSNML